MDKIIKVFCLIALIMINTLLLGISYQLVGIDKKLRQIELLSDIIVYK
jgi:hypothetical protein